MRIISKIIRLLTIPVIIAPLLLYFLASDVYEGALYTFWPIMLATLIVNIPLVFINTKRFNTTLLLGWAGAQIGCLLHISAAYGIIAPNYLIEWPAYLTNMFIIIPDWFILSILLGLSTGAVIDYVRKHPRQASKNTPA